jgi:hypothetical protein
MLQHGCGSEDEKSWEEVAQVDEPGVGAVEKNRRHRSARFDEWQHAKYIGNAPADRKECGRANVNGRACRDSAPQ